MQFRTSKGEILSETDERLINACKMVAAWMRENARATRKSDDYASHVTEEKKDKILVARLQLADEVERGEHLHTFWCWQRVNEILTGECVGFLG
jgi:hypothetical protein